MSAETMLTPKPARRVISTAAANTGLSLFTVAAILRPAFMLTIILYDESTN
ncbi:MAG: hypothetical protein IID45_00060 [Planctomycetes bacterium]|nr:hypothetical protein [Planctomycetota bacterium]